MKSEIVRIFRIVRDFLFSIVNKEFLIFLFFLALSGAFWLSMALEETYERELDIPVRLVNVPRNAIITTPIDDTLTVTVRDKGYAHFSYAFGTKIRPINLNFNTYANKETGNGQVPISDVQNIVYQRLYSSSRITQIKPDKLDFYFNFGLSRKLPVRMSGHVTPAKNYVLSHVRFWPEEVTVYASKHILDSLKYISTRQLNITNFEDTVFKTVELQSIKGVKCVPAKVRIGLFPDILTEANVEVPITAVNMPEGKVLRTFPSRVNVRFVIGSKAYRSIKPEHFKVIVNYREVEAHPSDKCNIYLVSSPRDVRQARPEVSQVDYLVEQQ